MKSISERCFTCFALSMKKMVRERHARATTQRNMEKSRSNLDVY